jgi:predicted  nucleic acid-binding Zn-ribbon protein
MTRIGGTGLIREDEEKRDNLSKHLKESFDEIQKAINKYEGIVDETNEWISKMREKFQIYYDSRKESWNDNSMSIYDSFKYDWDRTDLTISQELEEVRKLEEEMSKILEGLPANPDRRTERKCIPLFSRKLV